MASITPHKGGFRVQVYVAGARDSKVLRTMREAKAWGAARETELRESAGKPEAEKHTLGEALLKYVEDFSGKKGGSKWEENRITAFIRNFPEYASRTLEAADTTMWAEWRDRRMKGFIAPNGKKVREITGGSVLRELGLYSNMFSIARREWKWVEKSPLTDVGRPDNNAPRTRRVHPWRDVRRIVRGLGYVSGQVPETKSQEVALAFLFALRSAMRAGEILQLGAATLDLQKRVATVNHKMQYKTKLPRRIPLTRHAVRLLAPVADRELCFTVSSASLDALFRKTRDRLMIEDLHFHDSRAEALTRLAHKVDVLTLAKISGHKDVSLLSNTYYRESAEDIAARL